MAKQIKGFVRNLLPHVMLELRTGERTTRVPMIVDTGNDHSEIVVGRGVANFLDAEILAEPIEAKMASGKWDLMDACVIEYIWFGEWQKTVAPICDELIGLLGVPLLENCKLEVNFAEPQSVAITLSE